MHARFRPSSELKMAAAASMAAHVVASSRPGRRMGGCTCWSEPPRFLVVSCDARPADVYSSLAAKILGPPTTFNAAKLKVEFAGVELRINKQPPPFPGAYTLTHCDFTANLTLAVSGPMTSEQLAVDAAEGRRGGRVEGAKEVTTASSSSAGEREMTLRLSLMIRTFQPGRTVYLLVFSRSERDALLRQRRQPPAGAGRRFQILRLLQRAAAGPQGGGSRRRGSVRGAAGADGGQGVGAFPLQLSQVQPGRVLGPTPTQGGHHQEEPPAGSGWPPAGPNAERRRKWATPETIFNALLALLL